jgi:DNA replication protein DnaD
VGSTGKGYIKLYRDIRSHWIWSDPDYLRAWVDLLMMVNHEDKQILFNKKLITVKRGSRITSIRKLAERWGWSRGRVARFLDMLEQDHMIATRRTTQKTLINVINYSFYQSEKPKRGPRMRPPTEPQTEPRIEPQTEHKQYIKEDIIEDIKEEEATPFSNFPDGFFDDEDET